MLKKILESKKKMSFVHFAFLLLGVLCVLFGGVRLMSQIFLFILGLFLGNLFEKIMSTVKDYRLSQRVVRVQYNQVEYENMKNELQRYKEIAASASRVSKSSRIDPRSKVPVFDSEEEEYD